MVGNVPKQIPDNHLEKFCNIINEGPSEFCDDIKKFRRQLVCQYEAHHIGKYKIKKVKIFTKNSFGEFPTGTVKNWKFISERAISAINSI